MNHRNQGYPTAQSL